MPTARLAIIFKDFSSWTGYSSVGLSTVAKTTAGALRNEDISCIVKGVRHNIDLYDFLKNRNFTHVLIMAPWITPLDLKALLGAFPDVQFAVQMHTNVAALYGDFNGIANIRQYLDMTFSFPNLRVAGNSDNLVRWALVTYEQEFLYLPNIYPVEIVRRYNETYKDGTINIGAFGALRVEKNFITAAAAALAVQKITGRAVVLHMSVGCENEKNILRSLRQLTDATPGFFLVQHRWQSWDEFRKLVGRMDVLLQPSHTESFNMVTADGIAEGVPSVVSPAIAWAPDSWKANSDDALEIAAVAARLLNDQKMRAEGYRALTKHNADATRRWLAWLGCPVTTKPWYSFWSK